jgi:hypothetical protein
MAGPRVVLKYLARYTHRVAIANERLRGMDERTVTFAYKDYRQNSRARSMTLSGTEFLRRWVQHVLPRGFVKVRQYGLLSNRCREEKIGWCRRLLLVLATLAMLRSGGEVEPERRGRVCPRCGGRDWIVERRFGPESPPLGWPRKGGWDSS